MFYYIRQNSSEYLLKDGGSILEIKDVTEATNGVYTCTAFNIVGSASNSLNLTVLSKFK